jgi:iron(III) transport system substrate-binding protein
MNSARVAFIATIAAMVAFAGQAGAVTNSDASKKRIAEYYALAKKEGEVVWYTTSREAYLKGLSAFWKKKFPDVKLTILRKNSPQLVQTIEAEIAAGKPRADVFTSSLAYQGNEFKQKGWYTPHKPATFDRIDARFKDPDGQWVAQSMFLMLGAYNTNVIKDPKDLPKTYADLLDPKWKGKLLSAHPETSGSHTAFYGGIVSEKIDGGWSFLEKLGGQDMMFVKANAEAARMVTAGERPVAVAVSSHNTMVARAKGSPVDVFAYTDGVIVNMSPQGILKTAPHPNAAKLFSEWLFSDEGQEQFAVWGLQWPVVSGIPGPKGAPDLKSLKLIVPDLSFQIPDEGRMDFLKKFNAAMKRS